MLFVLRECLFPLDTYIPDVVDLAVVDEIDGVGELDVVGVVAVESVLGGGLPGVTVGIGPPPSIQLPLPARASVGDQT